MTDNGRLGEIQKKMEIKVFDWKISDFCSLSNCKNDWYTSQCFDFANASWYFSISPEGDEESSEGYIALYLHCDDDIESNISFILDLGFKREDEVENVKSELVRFEGKYDIWCYSDFFPRKELMKRKSELLADGTLTITCSMTYCDPIMPVDASSMKLIELETLSENFKDLFLNKETCDTILKLEDKEFKVHKAVLIARSSVFAAMFQHDMTEKQTSKASISDSDPESFGEFLEYLYTGRIESVTFESAFHLFTTADKYDVQKLKRFCVHYMMGNVTVENVCNVAILADKHDEDQLLASAQAFFNKNAAQTFKTKQWNLFMKENSVLAQNLLIKMSEGKEKKDSDNSS